MYNRLLAESAARRVRAAKSAASRYGAGSEAEADEKRHGLASDDDENGTGSAARGSGGTDASFRAVEKGGGGAGAPASRTDTTRRTPRVQSWSTWLEKYKRPGASAVSEKGVAAAMHARSASSAQPPPLFLSASMVAPE